MMGGKNMTEHKFVVKLVCYLSDEPEVLTEINFATRKEAEEYRDLALYAHDLLFFYRFIKRLVWVPRSTMSLSLMPNRYRWVIMILTCPIRRETLYRSRPFFSCI